MIDSIGYLVESNFMDDVPKNGFSTTSCKHGVLLAKGSAQGL